MNNMQFDNRQTYRGTVEPNRWNIARPGGT